MFIYAFIFISVAYRAQHLHNCIYIVSNHAHLSFLTSKMIKKFISHRTVYK
jgi:hypothetical protein